MAKPPDVKRAWRPFAVALVMGAALSWAHAAEGTMPTPAGGERSAIDAQYHADRLRCAKIDEEESRKACLKEAGAARQEALRGQLSAPSIDDSNLQRNALQRCTVHKDPVLRQACEDMVLGKGNAKGSVDAGGVYREMTITLDPVDEPAEPAKQ